MTLRILAFDISKKATGIAFWDGELDVDSLETIAFEDTEQWAKKVGDVIDKWSPDVITFSETVNRMCGHPTKRVMYGLMFMLEHIAYKRNIHVIPINDTPAKHLIGVKCGKRAQIKEDTFEWFYNRYHVRATEDEIESVSFCYYIHNTVK